MALRWIEGFEAVNNQTTAQDRLYETTTGGVTLLARDGANDPADAIKNALRVSMRPPPA